MAVIASFDIAANQIGAVVDEIYETTKKQPELTPRSKEELIALARDGNLALVYVDETLAGWGAFEPLVKNVHEVGMVYIKPELRTTEVFNALMNAIGARTEDKVAASYDPAYIRYVVRAWGGKYSSLLEVLWRSRGKFLTKRLNSQSRKAIQNRMKEKKPHYVFVRGK